MDFNRVLKGMSRDNFGLEINSINYLHRKGELSPSAKKEAGNASDFKTAPYSSVTRAGQLSTLKYQRNPRSEAEWLCFQAATIDSLQKTLSRPNLPAIM